MSNLRDKLDYNYIVSARLQEDVSTSDIARRESDRLKEYVSKNTIIGVLRDIRDGKLRVSKTSSVEPVRTFIYGKEHDNGGIPVFTGDIELSRDRFIVVSDLHIPYTDYTFLETVPVVAANTNTRTVVVAGDLFHGEQKSPWRKRGSLVRAGNFRDDIDIARKFFHVLVDAGVEEIYLMPGNHDNWLLMGWDGTLQWSDFTEMILDEDLRGYVIPTPYDVITLESGGHTWRAYHQRNTSVYPLKVGSELAQKHQCNTIITHQHRSAIGFDRFDRYVVVAIGGLHNTDMTAYDKLKTTTRPKTNKGYCIVDDGLVGLLVPDDRLTDWSMYGVG